MRHLLTSGLLAAMYGILAVAASLGGDRQAEKNFATERITAEVPDSKKKDDCPKLMADR